MFNLKRSASLLLALIMLLSMVSCDINVNLPGDMNIGEGTNSYSTSRDDIDNSATAAVGSPVEDETLAEFSTDISAGDGIHSDEGAEEGKSENNDADANEEAPENDAPAHSTPNPENSASPEGSVSPEGSASPEGSVSPEEGTVGTPEDTVADSGMTDEVVGSIGSSENTGNTPSAPSKLPDLKGKEAVILYYVNGNYTTPDWEVQENGGQMIDSAVYERNCRVEEELNVNIVSIGEHQRESIFARVKNDCLTMTGDYTVISAPSYMMTDMMLEGCLADLNANEHVNLDGDAWHQGFNSALETDERQYFAVGGATLSFWRAAYITAFNKNMFEQFGIEYPYDAVSRGDWTLEYQYTMIQNIGLDDNSNGVCDEYDRYGLVMPWGGYQLDMYLDLIASPSVSGGNNFDVGTDGYPELLEKLEGQMLPYYNARNASWCIYASSNNTSADDLVRMFANGNAAMLITTVYHTSQSNMMNMDSEYGILPMPKLMAEYEGYRTPVAHTDYNAVALPAVWAKSENAAVLERLSVHGMNIVIKDMYMDKMMFKVCSDRQSKDNTTLIFDGIAVDAASLLGIRHEFIKTDFLDDKYENAKATYKANERALTATLKKLNKKYDELAH